LVFHLASLQHNHDTFESSSLTVIMTDPEDSPTIDEKKDPGSPAYEEPRGLLRNELESLEYSSTADSHYTAFADESSVTGHAAHFHGSRADATTIVHEMHLALLYLLSHPEEFQKALGTSSLRPQATTLAEWNAEYDLESIADDSGSVHTFQNNTQDRATPLPFVVFADDAEVVLPAALTASQLFGLERIDGIELEAAAGVQSISQLFLRWLGTFTRSWIRAISLLKR
jgi:hypothetical protein